MEPRGRRVGSAAATPDWAATPAAVTNPLQYAVAAKESLIPTPVGGAVASAPTARSQGKFCESSIVTSYSQTKPMAATSETSIFHRIDLASIASSIVVGGTGFQ